VFSAFPSRDNPNALTPSLPSSWFETLANALLGMANIDTEFSTLFLKVSKVSLDTLLGFV
jgi:hypothetical protein